MNRRTLSFLPLVLIVATLLQACSGGGSDSAADRAAEDARRRAAATSDGPPVEALLLLNRYSFDPVRGEPTLPPELSTTYAPGIEGFYLVQLTGPTQDSWLERLTASGVKLVQFQPTHAYIARMTPENATKIRSETFVRAVVVYHAAYRIAPPLLDMTGGTIENVVLTIYDDGAGSVDRTRSALTQRGGKPVEGTRIASGASLIAEAWTLPGSALVPVAQENAVLWLNFRPPVDVLEDENSDQIVGGNFNPITTGYANWLTARGLTGGGGQTVAIVDTGVDTGVDATVHPDLRGRLVPVGTPSDGNGHGTHVAGIIAGNGSLGTLDANGFVMGLGVAPAARLVARVNTGNDADRTRDVVTNGAIAANNSYQLHGAGTGYQIVDRTYDMLVRDANQTTAGVAEPLVIVFSAGNSGTTGPTKEAKNIIAVANSFNQSAGNIDTLATSSSRGPAQDGRISARDGTGLEHHLDALLADGPHELHDARHGCAGHEPDLHDLQRHVDGGAARDRLRRGAHRVVADLQPGPRSERGDDQGPPDERRRRHGHRRHPEQQRGLGPHQSRQHHPQPAETRDLSRSSDRIQRPAPATPCR